MSSHTTFVAAELSPVDGYKLLSGLIVPRPIGWIGSRSPDGGNNLAPFSFFNGVCNNPPTVMFSVMVESRVKDTAANVEASGEFTVNIVTVETAEAMNTTSGEYESGIDEFEVAGLSAVDATIVAAPMVAEATAQLECRRTFTHDIGPEGGPTVYRVFFGEVVAFHVADRVLDGTRIRPHELAAIGRLAGSGYTTTTDGYFEMERPHI